MARVRRGRRPPLGKEIKAKFEFTPESLRAFERVLLDLMQAADPKTQDEALMAGAEVVKSAQIKSGPGPHIVIDKVTASALKKGRASGQIKKGITANSRFVGIGPDKKRWYYRFHEFGVKPHGVKRRKVTRQRQAAGKKDNLLPRLRNMKPMMSWLEGGRPVFARRVSGFAASPFIGPSVDNNRSAISKAMADVLRDEILKAVVSR